MSRRKLRKFEKVKVGNATQRQRTERHGKPQVMRKRVVKQDAQGNIVMAFEWVPVPAEGYTRTKVAVASTSPGGGLNTPPSKGVTNALPQQRKK